MKQYIASQKITGAVKRNHKETILWVFGAILAFLVVVTLSKLIWCALSAVTTLADELNGLELGVVLEIGTQCSHRR